MSDDLRDALRRADAWRAAAEQRWRLRADFERELGLSASIPHEENVEHGLAAIRALKAEAEQLRARVAELEHPRSYLPPGVERVEAVFASNVLATEQERDEWVAKAKLSAQVASAWESLYRERQFAVDRVDAVLEILAANGCDCECHDGEEHDDDCERCLACRIEQAVER